MKFKTKVITMYQELCWTEFVAVNMVDADALEFYTANYNEKTDEWLEWNIKKGKFETVPFDKIFNIMKKWLNRPTAVITVAAVDYK